MDILTTMTGIVFLHRPVSKPVIRTNPKSASRARVDQVLQFSITAHYEADIETACVRSTLYHSLLTNFEGLDLLSIARYLSLGYAGQHAAQYSAFKILLSCHMES